MSFIDLRSDTVTKPTKGMLLAMSQAKVGDDVFGEDPSVTELEEMAADIFGMEAGLFCPSGIMTNQIAIKVLTNPPGELICDRSAHIYNYEGGGIAFNSGLSTRLLESPFGIFSVKQVLENINPDNVHYPSTQMVAVENTANRGGGSIWPIETLRELSLACKENNLKFHLDGARIFNALVAKVEDAQTHGKLFNTISVCLSKGLGAPVGSVLLGKTVDIKQARRIRRMLGGGMRQAGFIAAAGVYALQNNIERLVEDHIKAKELAECVTNLSYVETMFPVETNIVVFKLKSTYLLDKFLDDLKKEGVLAVPFGIQTVRLVTHLDVTQNQIERTKLALLNLNN